MSEAAPASDVSSTSGQWYEWPVAEYRPVWRGVAATRAGRHSADRTGPAGIDARGLRRRDSDSLPQSLGHQPSAYGPHPRVRTRLLAARAAALAASRLVARRFRRGTLFRRRRSESGPGAHGRPL